MCNREISFQLTVRLDSSSDDLLGRKSFAQSIATAIVGWEGKDSLVVAIYGKWGSGKSSLKNMIVEALIKREHGLEILDFNPWSWSGSDQLSEHFFVELGVAIGRIDKSKQSRKLVGSLRRYGAYLSAGTHIFAGISSLLRCLFIAALGLGFASAWVLDHLLAQPLIILVLIILLLGAPFLKWMEGLLAKFVTIASQQAENDKSTLSDLKNEIKADISKLSRGVLVIMDDIDRLERERVREIMQLVRQNADFPNIVYLLPFQRDIVEKLLYEEDRSGRAYLEKIVQVAFNLPEIEKARVDKVLFRRLDSILGSDPEIHEHFDSARWSNLYERVLKYKFETLRDAYRVLGTLEFHVSVHRGEHAFEVNPIDLIAIETIRVFEPEFHNAIFRARNLLTSFSEYDHDGMKEQRRNDIEAIVGQHLKNFGSTPRSS